MKRRKITTTLLIAFTLALTIALSYSTFLINNASADKDGFSGASSSFADNSIKGNQNTARQKVWYSMLVSCVNQPAAWGHKDNSDKFHEMLLSFGGMNTMFYQQQLSKSFGYLTSSQVRNGEWFKDSAGDPVTTNGSAYIEARVEKGPYGDGKFTCGTGDNELAKASIGMSNKNDSYGTLALSAQEVACGTSNQPGVLTPINAGNCQDALNSNGDGYYFSPNKDTDTNQYMATLAEKSIKDEDGNVPGGTVDQLTALERYFVLYDAFGIACADVSRLHFASPDEDPGNFDYQILADNGSGKVELAGVTKLGSSSPDTQVAIYKQETATCTAIEAQLQNEDSQSIKDFKEYIANGGEQNNPQSADIDECKASGVAENLGWIICPILNIIKKSTETIYADYVEPKLQISPKIFSQQQDNDSAAQQAWATFQGLANILFIIFFLFVIFSQVTGVGIDNYGIKKIMPKLIVVAILINLSYIICEVCVDLSNIVGNGIQTMLNSFTVNVENSAMYDTDTLKTIGTTSLTGVAIFGGIAATVYLATPAIFLSFFVAAIGLIISVFFLFILLVGREAAILVLTVISPLAFACYLLPNTKKLFDRWLKIWEGLLLVYPIAGLLVGGGNFVSRIIIATGAAGEGTSFDFFSAFSAMMISIIPIFFIPTVLKGSFAALGNLGATLSGLGGRLSGKAKSGIRSSDAYKNAQQRSNEWNAKKRAAIGKDVSKMGLASRFLHGYALTDRGIAKARAQHLKNQDVKDRADRLTSDVGFKAAQIAQEKAIESDRVKDYMAYINSETNNGENEDKFNDLVEQYANGGDKYGVAAAARIAGRRKDTADAFLKKHFTENKKQYSKEMRNALAKEIATGENKGNYMASAPLGFEYASQLNKGTPSAASADNYSEWLKDKNNIHDALDNYVTNSSQLVGLKNSSLENIYKLAYSRQMNEADIDAISKLAYDTKANKDKTGVWDRTKADVIDKLIELRHPDPGETFTFKDGI